MRAPNDRSTSSITSTSRRRGMPWSVIGLDAKTVAAKIGNAAFLAP
jgi:hypothetical protein